MSISGLVPGYYLAVLATPSRCPCQLVLLCICHQVLKELAPYKNLVVATGGGAVTRPKNWSYMHNGVVAWLQGQPDLLARRVVAEGIEKRPLLFGDGVSGELLVQRIATGGADTVRQLQTTAEGDTHAQHLPLHHST